MFKEADMADKLIIAETAAEALEAKNGSSAFFAGGTEIERLHSFVHADTLILLKKIPGLDTIEEKDGCLRIGAMCTFEKALQDALVPEYLKTALSFMASRTKRNMATIGGNISITRCDSYLLPTLMAAGARVELLEKTGKTEIAEITAYAENRDSYDDALIAALILPYRDVRVVSKRFANTAESHACLTLALGNPAGRTAIGAAVKNAGLFSLEELAGKMDAASLSEEEIMEWCRSWSGAEIKDDMFGSAAYKRYLLGVTLTDLYRTVRGGDVK